MPPMASLPLRINNKQALNATVTTPTQASWRFQGVRECVQFKRFYWSPIKKKNTNELRTLLTKGSTTNKKT